MEIGELQRHWETMARTDPMWAVLTGADKRYGGWDEKEFRETGDVQAAKTFAFLDGLADRGVTFGRERAVDFGCGPGRMSQPLCRYFERVDGVDIAPSMIALAREWNQYGDRCVYHLNDQPNLRLFDDATFDFTFSFQVLQHIAPELQTTYIQEFGRLLRPGGVAFFQICTAEKTGATGPLPVEAFRAEIDVPAPPLPLPAGATAGVRVKVKNTSSVAWPVAGTDGWYCVTVANRWLTRKGDIVVGDDARAFLPDVLGPGGSGEVVLSVTAPRQPGKYVLEVDLVQEGVAWFQDHGSKTARVRVDVVDAGDAGGEPAGELTPIMEMHVVPLDTARDVLASAGVELVTTIGQVQLLDTVEHDFERTFVVGQKR